MKQYAYLTPKKRTEESTHISYTGVLQGGDSYANDKRAEVFIGETQTSSNGIKVENWIDVMQLYFQDIEPGDVVRVTYTPRLSDAVKTGDRITQYQQNELIKAEVITTRAEPKAAFVPTQIPNDDILNTGYDQHDDPIDRRERPEVY